MKKKILIATLLLTAVAVVVAKGLFFPSVKDAYFAMDERSLRHVPAGTIIVRPTHFPFLKEKGILRTSAPSDKNTLWQMGRNVPLRDVMAAGYNWNQARILLPPDAANARFDFLMTGASNQLTRFQATIRREIGYTGQVESRNAEVIALKIANPALPAFTISRDDEQQRINFNMQQEKLHFTKMPLKVLVNIFGRFLQTPMVDKTGQTNLYSFDIDWNSKTDKNFEGGTMTREMVEQMLGSLGLKLEPDTAPMEMLVVKQANQAP